jgi:hypothetical protein
MCSIIGLTLAILLAFVRSPRTVPDDSIHPAVCYRAITRE